MLKWLGRLGRRPRDVVGGCLMPAGSVRGDHVPNWTGPREPLSRQDPLANYLCLLFEKAVRCQADTAELTLEVENDLVRARLKGPGGWQTAGGPPSYVWSNLLFTCLHSAEIESCQATIADPASGEQWRFDFRKQDNQIRLSKLVPAAPASEPPAGNNVRVP
ncbi:MAG: hypothetical protein MUC88_19390 [Planctomycetes bacterium]|nr:hypothetical protein [Planctomycetota bacterium]